MSVHLLVPGAWTVQAAHDLAEEIEAELGGALANLTVVTHIEPIEDPASFGHHEPFPETAPEVTNPHPPQTARPLRLKIASVAGAALLLGGGVAGVVVSGVWLDLALAAVLFGFVLILAVQRRGGRQRKAGRQ